MGERQRETLVFGRGIDRYSGVMVAQPAAFADLRNVHLQFGRVENRLGHELRKSIGDDAVLAIQPVRSAGVVGVVTLDGADVKLYQAPPDLSSATLIGTTVWSSMPVTSGFPRVILADADRRLVICHDEPNYTDRKVTRVWDVAAATISDLTADLYAATDPETKVATYFRGAVRHLQTVFLWGYGSENAGDGDAPEYVRNGTALDPLDLKQQHYFIAGQRFEPVTCCTPASGRSDEPGVLLVFKEAETLRITGYDRTTFKIEPVEPVHGCVNARMAITVGGWAYYWSLQGPRRSDGGASEDLALPLDLGGPLPSTLADVASQANAFVVHYPDRREIAWVFGKWAYVLSIADPARPEWSYREFGFEPNCATVVFQSAGSVSPPAGIAPEAYPDITACALDAVTDRSFDITWDNIGTLNSAIDTAEVWAKPASTGVWSRLASGIALAGLNDTTNQTAPHYADSHEIAVRFLRSGVAAAAYASANPSDWPSISRYSGLVTEWTGSPTLSSPTWERLDATTERMVVSVSTAAVQDNLTIDVEYSTNGGGAWSAAPDGPFAPSGGIITYAIPVGQEETNIMLRANQSNAYQTGTPGAGISMWCGPQEIPTALVLTQTGMDGIYTADFDPNGATDEYVEIWAGKDSGAKSLVHTTGWNGSGAQIAVACPATQIEAKVRRKTTYFGTDDFSDYTADSVVAADCDGLL